MTTKYKIIVGFSIMALLLVVVGAVGYFSTEKAADNFHEYDRLAHFNIAMSDMESAMFETSTDLYDFINTKEPVKMEKARKAVARALKEVSEAEKLSEDPTRIQMMKTLHGVLDGFNKHLTDIEREVMDADNLYRTDVQVDARNMMEQMRSSAKMMEQSENIPGLAAVAEIWDDLAAARSSISRYAESLDPGDAKRTWENFSNTDRELTTLRSQMYGAQGTQQHEALAKAFNDMKDSFGRMETLGTKAMEHLTIFSKQVDEQTAVTHTINEQVDHLMEEFRDKMNKESDAAQRQMLLFSAGGVIAGIVVALIIVLGLIRVLRALSVYASGISRGDFNQQLSIREKGEIGTMVNAMRQIPEVLNTVIAEASKLSESILAGRMRTRLDTAMFSGTFADLATSVNSVGDAYTGVIDTLPLPVMSCDNQLQIQFLNKAAQNALGNNYVNDRCSTHLEADSCSGDCFGKRAMTQNTTITGETVIRPQGKRMVVSVTAIPLHASNGTVVGYTEILTDLTTIKDQQNTILQVASEASEIADRVAAASEQIAAQVEQISRGSDIQRSRVESTASAMTEMNSTVLEVAQNAGRAAEQSDGTRQKAENGAEIVNNVVAAISTVNSVASAMQKNMQELGEQAESIGGVMNVISDIADQTNLLALNAAIEAARAGEAGRGFAVVADEVRKLAEKTMQATQEVGRNIANIQQAARKNIADMENAAKGVSEATELAQHSGEALSEIVDLASSNSAVVASIATAAEEQSATSEEINRAIEEINTIVAETTEGIAQSSAAVQELAATAQQLRRVMESLG